MNTITRLTWDARDYEAGIDRGVFYPPIGAGEAWNGLISVTETPAEAIQRQFYQDGHKVVNRPSSGFFAGTINAISYPPSFYADILVQRRVKPIGLSYRTMTKDHYRLHLVYNVLLAPSAFVNQQSSIETHSWGFTTLPIEVPGIKRSAHLVIETEIAYSWTVQALEDILYGTEGDQPRLPLPDEVFEVFEVNSILQIIDHGDGSWTAIGPDSAIIMLDSTTFEITWPSAVYIDAESYTIHSL